MIKKIIDIKLEDIEDIGCRQNDCYNCKFEFNIDDTVWCLLEDLEQLQKIAKKVMNDEIEV